MGNNGVKNIILMVILVVLSFFLGIQAADGASAPIMLIGALVGIFGLLYLGERVWMAIYLAPPFIPLIGIPSPNVIYWPAVCACGIFGYWIIMRVMGYVHMRWQGQIIIDTLCAIILIYMGITFYRHPVGFGGIDFGTDTIGGRAYILAIECGLGFIGCSLIPMGYERITKITKYLFYVTITCTVLMMVRNAAFGGSGASSEMDLMEQAQNTRFGLLAPLGLFVLCYIYGYVPFIRILTSPKYFLIVCGCFLALLLAGWRSKLLGVFSTVVGIGIAKREVIALAVCGLSVYGTLFYLSEENVLTQLPYGIQRSLCAIPGQLKVEKVIRYETANSTQWRQKMWRWAMDPRTHLVHDYIFGDGPGDSASEIRREFYDELRYRITSGDPRVFARRGAWHSGWVTVIHRLGFVGLGLIGSFHALIMFFVLYVLRIYRKTEIHKYLAPLIASQFADCIVFYISTGTLDEFFKSLYLFAYVKLLYCAARDEGLVPNLFRQESYTPMAIRDIEQPSSPQPV